MGLPADPRRVGLDGHQTWSVDGVVDPQATWNRSFTAANRTELGGVPPRPGQGHDGVRLLQRRHDAKFPRSFDEVFRADGTRIQKTPARAPRANAICERVIGTLRRECLNQILILGRRHLDAVLAEYVPHHNDHRPHRSLGQLCPRSPSETSATLVDIDPRHVRRADCLGGLIHEYRIVA
jgi:putative transposase